MRFAIVVPADDLDVLRSELQYLRPAIIPQEIRRKHPVLAVRHLGAIVGEEPWGCRYKIGD